MDIYGIALTNLSADIDQFYVLKRISDWGRSNGLIAKEICNIINLKVIGIPILLNTNVKNLRNLSHINLTGTGGMKISNNVIKCIDNLPNIKYVSLRITPKFNKNILKKEAAIICNGSHILAQYP